MWNAAISRVEAGRFLGVAHDIASDFLTLIFYPEASALLHVAGVGFFMRFMKCLA
jgi:hypothetical protein